MTNRLQTLSVARRMRTTVFDPQIVLDQVAAEVSCWNVGRTARYRVATAAQHLVQEVPVKPNVSLQHWWLVAESNDPPLTAARPMVVRRLVHPTTKFMLRVQASPWIGPLPTTDPVVVARHQLQQACEHISWATPAGRSPRRLHRSAVDVCARF